jgi:hypothetical protein
MNIGDLCARMRDRFTTRVVEPLRMRVWLRSAPAWDAYYPLRIEGALQHIAIARVADRMPDDVFAGYRGPMVELAIPVADVEMRGRKIACASRAIPAEGWRFVTRMRARRTRAELINKPTVMTNGGEYKALALPVPSLSAAYLDFFVRGDRAMLADLCVDLRFLGRDGPRGWGTVDVVEIDEDPDDRSLIFERRPQRPLPVADDHEAALLYDPGSYELREIGTRAPYWHRDSRALCAVPS